MKNRIDLFVALRDHFGKNSYGWTAYEHLQWYQENARIYLDEYQEDRNLFMENRFLRRQ